VLEQCENVNSYDPLSFLYSMNTLAEMFELDRPVVHSIISKMIINGELQVLENLKYYHVQMINNHSGMLAPQSFVLVPVLSRGPVRAISH
jgi:hypothetical protein